MKPETVKRAIQSFSARFPGEAGVSAWHFPDSDAEEAANLLPTQHRHYRATTAGTLREAGFEVGPASPRGHVTIKFQGPGTDEEIEELIGCFEPEEVRPQYS